MVKDTVKLLLSTGLLATRHFRICEFFDSSTADIKGISNVPPTYEHLRIIIQNIQVLACYLEVLRSSYRDKPILINSGYRCKALNTAVGGVALSKHLYGAAVDITSTDPETFDDLCDSVLFCFDGSPYIYYEINKDRQYIHLHLKTFNRFTR